MIAKFEGYDKDGHQFEYGVDIFRRYTVYRNLTPEDIADEPDVVLYGSGRLDDKIFNLVYFEDADRNIIDIVQTASVGYLMDENGKTFEVIRLKK